MIKKYWDKKNQKWSESNCSRAFFKTPEERRKAVKKIKQKRKGKVMTFNDLMPPAERIISVNHTKKRLKIRRLCI